MGAPPRGNVRARCWYQVHCADDGGETETRKVLTSGTGWGCSPGALGLRRDHLHHHQYLRRPEICSRPLASPIPATDQGAVTGVARKPQSGNPHFQVPSTDFPEVRALLLDTDGRSHQGPLAPCLCSPRALGISAGQAGTPCENSQSVYFAMKTNNGMGTIPPQDKRHLPTPSLLSVELHQA